MKKIAILGSTGSIGTQTLDVVRANGDLEVVGISVRRYLKECRRGPRTDPDRKNGNPQAGIKMVCQL